MIKAPSLSGLLILAFAVLALLPSARLEAYQGASRTGQTQPGPLEHKSSIAEVLLYRQGALIKRKGQVQLQAGDQTLDFIGLEQNIRSGSAQLALSKGATILMLAQKQDPARPAADPDSLVALRIDRDSLSLDLADLRARKLGLREELMVLEANRNITAEQATIAGNAQAVTDAARLYNEQTTKVHKNLARLDLRERDLSRQLESLDQRIRAIRPGPTRPVGRISTQLDVERPGTYTYELTYIAADAYWYPEYDLFIDTEGTPAGQLLLSASVMQGSGVDWDKVKLTLSTSDINTRIDAPGLSPYYLHDNSEMAFLAGAAPAPRARMNMTKSAEPEAMMAMDVMEEEAIAAPALSVAQQTLTARIYIIDRPFSVAASNVPATVRLTENKVQPQLRYTIVPKLDPTAYLEGLISSWDTLGLLSGPMRVHIDNRYLGIQQLDPQSSADTLVIGLGADPRINVSRKGWAQSSDVKPIRGRKSFQRGYEINLRNTLNRSVDIRVLDQIPVSQREEIQVEFQSASDNPILEETSGRLTWNLSLPAATARKLQVRYKVEAPRSYPIALE